VLNAKFVQLAVDSELYRAGSNEETFAVELAKIEANKLCAWRHDMPPPLSSPWAPQRFARSRAVVTKQ